MSGLTVDAYLKQLTDGTGAEKLECFLNTHLKHAYPATTKTLTQAISEDAQTLAEKSTHVSTYITALLYHANSILTRAKWRQFYTSAIQREGGLQYFAYAHYLNHLSRFIPQLNIFSYK
ncbi:hypothetical protein HRbin01_00023 [archaeon HR01]|nr:hypothetical protein HRbin01_00023 [archaeon HR01]